MKRFFAILFLLLTALVGRAALVEFSDDTRDYQENSKWAGKDNWTNADAIVQCLARRMGVGVKSNRGIVGTYDNVTMSSVRVVVVASGKTAAAANRERAVTLSVNNGEEVHEATFEFGGAYYSDTTTGKQIPLNFNLTETMTVQSLHIMNTTGGEITFEIYSVETFSEYPPITVDADLPSMALSGKAMPVGIIAIEGGSYNYQSAQWQWYRDGEPYNDTVYPVDLTSYALIVPVMAPEEGGEYELVLTVVDALDGSEYLFKYPVSVRTYRPATNFRLSGLTYETATVKWDVPAGDSPEQFHLVVCPQGATKTMTMKIDFNEEPIFIDLLRWAGERTLSNGSYLHFPEGVTLQQSTDGETWEDAEVFAERYSFGTSTSLWLRVSQACSATLYLDFNDETVMNASLPADSRREATLTGLSAGRTYELRFTTEYTGGTSLSSTPFIFSTPPLPGFKEIKSAAGGLYLYWPDETMDGGSIEHWYECAVETTVPEGLYLTHLYLTSGPAAKAIVISNNSAKPIHLDGTYTLLSRCERDEGDPIERKWDFSDGETYPYTVPAYGQLTFFARSLTLPDDLDVYPNTYAVSSAVIRGFTKDYTVSLQRSGATINTLTPVLNAVAHLDCDTLHTTITSSVDDPTRFPTALLESWVPKVTPKLYRTQNLAATATMTSYSVPTIPNLKRYWIEARTHLGLGRSEPFILELYKAEPAEDEEEAPGYFFRLR